ncbi:NADP-dependent 3-hydroxy acid dehydrogenase YdfG [Blastococcus sp. DSM 46786]|uniref:SDR family NAD(P)-dependent oxidoreductase n=1 Tax=Blastococcus sp. DSM 46786 TaxID=1798227 RepID=UPI0008B90BE3|nr:SDR family oxidoreductase [Blastococcus sp. DSM 46786]SEK72502.1 NADP-dependent 3-hydroxy acid dehydrogenase YdfG [Blastococcus sp. DSM 46786]
MNRYDGKRVFLTGAGSGIGRATAVRLVAEGATVFAVDRDDEGLAATRELVEDPARLTCHTADLSTEDAVVAAAGAGVAELGQIDVLANVAGALRTTPMTGLDLDDYRWLFAINLFAPVTLCRELLPHVSDRTGVIVLTTSTAATKAHPGMTGYAASKGALLSFAVSLSAELAPRRIRVVPVSPGGVATPLTMDKQRFQGIDVSWYARTYPLWGKPGKPEDLAAAIAFAGSADGAYLNGTEFRLDGGSHV